MKRLSLWWKRKNRASARSAGRKVAIWKKVLYWCAGGIFAAAALAALGLSALFLYFSYGADLPSVEKLRNYRPQQSVRLLDRNGQLLSIVGRQRRTVIPYDQIPKVVVQAVLAAEDAMFFRHEGLNYLGMVRAFWVNVFSGRYRQGGSTITQQVVKCLLLTPERSLRRKFQEVILARRVENVLSKEQILWIYLNEIYFGHGRYGVEEASRLYFRKPVAQVALSEAALLAALPQGPELNSPIRHPQRAMERRRYVLSQMLKHGFISRQDFETADAAPLLPGDPEEVDSRDAPEAVTYIQEKHAQLLDSAAGTEVRATLDLRVQKIAREALQRGLRELDGRQNVTHLKHLSGAALKRHLQQLALHRPQEGRIYEGVVKGRADGRLVVDLGSAEGIVVEGMERYYPDGYVWGEPEKQEPAPKKSENKKSKTEKPAKPYIREGHVFRVRVLPGDSRQAGSPLRLRAELGPQGAVVVLHAATREVLAVVGGEPYSTGDFNRAMDALRQPGSSFKPFFYAVAIMNRKLTPASILRDDPEVYQKWIPRSGHDFQGEVTLRRALNLSLNTVAVQVLQIAGLDETVEFARNAGITTPLRKDLSLALGASEVRLIDMVNAYAVFASGGLAMPVNWILSVGGKAVEREPYRRVMNPASAWLVTSLLRTVITEGTGRRAAHLRFPVAGKTGTTNGNRDAWFIGFSPEIVCGVWIGYDDSRPLGSREEGGRAAVPVFAQILQQTREWYRKGDFFIPPGITTREIDPDTGQAVLPGAPRHVTEYFLEGTEPPLPEMVPVPAVEPGAAPDATSVGDLLTR